MCCSLSHTRIASYAGVNPVDHRSASTRNSLNSNGMHSVAARSFFASCKARQSANVRFTESSAFSLSLCPGCFKYSFTAIASQPSAAASNLPTMRSILPSKTNSSTLGMSLITSYSLCSTLHIAKAACDTRFLLLSFVLPRPFPRTFPNRIRNPSTNLTKHPGSFLNSCSFGKVPLIILSISCTGSKGPSVAPALSPISVFTY